MPPAPSRRSIWFGSALPIWSGAALRALACLGVLALLSACAGQSGGNAVTDARGYRAHARGNYTPPGPPSDPWGPYVVEASKRYDVPEVWIREVMRVESGGNLYRGGDLVTSGAGAMGLMQVMPGTYSELQERHNLSDDAYDPHNNILAGTAYIREMYDIYGSPGFLAAYNAGPRRLDDYLANQRDLPLETRRYVAKIGPNIVDAYPANRSQAEQYAMNSLPTNIPAGLRYPRGARTQVAQGRDSPARGGGRDVQMAQLTPPSGFASVSYAGATPAPPPPAPPPAAPAGRGGFQLISGANAAPAPTPRGGGGGGQWAIQIGAFSSESLARNATGNAIAHARDMLGGAQPQISSVRQHQGTLYRARLVGLSQASAQQACERLQRNRSTCVVVSPDARS